MSVRHALLALLSEGPKYGLQLRQEFEATDGRGLAAERRAGVHDAAAAGARRVRRVRRRDRRGRAEELPDHRRGRDRADPVAAHAARPQFAAARRAGREGAGGTAGARDRRPRRDPGASPLPGRADAAVDPAQGRRAAGRPELRAGRRRRAVPAGLGHPVARRRRRPDQARRRRTGARARVSDAEAAASGRGYGDERARTALRQQGLRPRTRPRCTR